MKKFLLCTVAAASAAVMVAAPVAISHGSLADKGVKTTDVRAGERVIASRQLAKGVRLNVVQDAQGRVFKKIDAPALATRINPGVAKAVKSAAKSQRAAATADVPYSENFEGWDGVDRDWLPEGMQSVSLSTSEDATHWGIAAESDFMGFMGNLTGNNASINYCSVFVDERLVLPPVTVGDDMSLSMDIYNDGFWYFSTDNVDWDTYEYVGGKELVLDQKVLVSTDGGQSFEVLKSFADDFMDMNCLDLIMESQDALRHVNIPLTAYAGQTITLAFQYVGTDGNTSAVDNITIGKPTLEVSYANPMGTLFYGMSKESYCMNGSILLAPVYSDLNFLNTTWVDGTYQWDYMNADSDMAVSDDPDMLTVSYVPDHTSPFTQRNNLFYTPVLSGIAPGFSTGSFTRGDYIQAGGKCEFEVALAAGQPKKLVDFGASVIDGNSEGATFVTDAMVPIFGYSANSDNYWTSFTFDGDEGEGDYAHLTHYMNYFFTSEAPMVINGVWAQAVGTVTEAASFTCEVVALDEEGVFSNVLATGTATGDFINRMDLEGQTDQWLTLYFVFDQPLVISSDVCDAYVVRISGFRDAENVEYFSPLMSENDNPDQYALGWVMKEMSYGGEVNPSLSPVVNYTGVYQSFFINLDAEFPWLTGETEKELGIGANTISLDSYHPADRLEVVNAPQWLTAEFAGRYNEATLSLTVAEGTPESSADIIISGPGVSHTVTLSVKADGIERISADSLASTPATLYNLQGVKVDASTAAPGLYILRDASGTSRKALLK